MTEHAVPNVTQETAGADISVRLPTDPVRSGGNRIVVPVPGAPAQEPHWWDALFLAFLHRYTGSEHFYLVSAATEDGACRLRGLSVGAGDTLGALIERVRDTAREPARATRVVSRVPVLAGACAALDAYGDAVDIYLAVDERRVTVCAAASLWRRESVERMAEHLATMAGAANGSARIGDLPLLTPAERSRTLVTWNDTSQDWPATDYLSILAHQVKSRPGAPALVCARRTVTFAELDRTGNKIAQSLRRMGAKPGERVGLLFPRSAEYVIAAVGVLKSGAAMVPLDPANPDVRLSHMIVDAAPVAVITTDALRYRVPDIVPSLRFGTDFRGEPAEPVPVDVSGDTISHLIYTSGSTGRPKAVRERHAALANLVYWTQRAYDVRAEDRASWLTAPGFGVQIIEWVPFLGLGVPIYIGDAANPTPEDLRDWLLAHSITHSLLPSAMAERVWALDWPARTALRVMVATGERVHHWSPVDLPFKAVVTYGSTETTNVLSCLDMGAGVDLTASATPAEVRASRPVPVGRPMSNVRVYLLDGGGHPVPVGVVGRLHVAGTGLSAGYYNQPEPATTKFRPNFLPEEPGEVLCDTGDLACFRADGAVEVLGRSGTQINIRGFRVELGDVEAALCAVPGVDEAVVTVHEPAPGDVRLVAYVASRTSPPTPAGVRSSAAELLPDYMIPGLVVVLDVLPKLANGKVDRRGLPAPEGFAAAAASMAFVPPDGPIQEELTRIWSALFRVDHVSATAHFWEIGGHSLLAFRLIGKVRAAFGAEISLPDLWTSSTVQDLAALIAERRDPAQVLEPDADAEKPAARR